MNNLRPYDSLSPAVVMDAIESVGYRCTGLVNPLNSYENRVYEVGVENALPVIAKFYRPNRWSFAQIREEHIFANQLEEAEVPVVAAIKIDGESLFEYEGYTFCLYEKRGGRSIELIEDEDFRTMGRLIGRIHSIGSLGGYEHRETISPKLYGWDNLEYLRTSKLVPADILPAYDSVVVQLLNQIDTLWKNYEGIEHVRLHGDCHLGNILKDTEIFFVDLDDSLMGPAVQDLWLFATGGRSNMLRQFGLLIDGYTQVRGFDYRQLQLVEAMRSLRMIHYTAWIAKRWEDPTFKHNFAFLDTYEYWNSHLQSLREQMAELHEPMLIQV